MALPVQHTVRTNNTVGSASLSTGGTLSMSEICRGSSSAMNC